jgi:hypothetical protein
MAELAMLTPSPSPEAYNEVFFFQLSRYVEWQMMMHLSNLSHFI